MKKLLFTFNNTYQNITVENNIHSVIEEIQNQNKISLNPKSNLVFKTQKTFRKLET